MYLSITLVFILILWINFHYLILQKHTYVNCFARRGNNNVNVFCIRNVKWTYITLHTKHKYVKSMYEAENTVGYIEVLDLSEFLILIFVTICCVGSDLKRVSVFHTVFKSLLLIVHYWTMHFLHFKPYRAGCVFDSVWINQDKPV